MSDTQKEQKNLLLDHDYDGIQELDNDLPPWWKNLFYTTVAFGIVYLLGYQIFGWFDNQYKEYYKAALANLEVIRKSEETAANKPASADDIKNDIVAGEKIFKTNCTVCHGNNAEGKIGPNLTDKYWLHGGDFPSVQHTISEGVPAKGMLSWKNTLGPVGVRQAARYVLSLQGTNPADAKAPEGVLQE